MTQLRFLVVELLMLVRKASEIARFLRQDNQLLTLLTQQKTCDLSKRHFVRDFKTLADVIIQQLVIERLRSLLPRFGPISGEESDLFQCPDGRLIRVRVSPDRDQLTAILRQLIPDFDCCDRLAAVILNEPPTDDIESLLIDQIPNDLIIDESQLGVWIDPIDSTNEYVKTDKELAETTISSDASFAIKGLPTVACLIGVYRLIDGIPIVGIVRLPFHGTIGLSQWAVHLPGLCIAHNLAFPVSHRRSTAPISVLLGNDRASDALADRCTADGLQVFRVSGAGYKLWLLINQMVDAWIVPTATVYNWDTCAGHVLLKAAHVATGGDLLTLSPIDATFRPHDYRLTDANKNHSTSADSGIAALIAYRDSALIPILKQKLSLNLNKCE